MGNLLTHSVECLDIQLYDSGERLELQINLGVMIIEEAIEDEIIWGRLMAGGKERGQVLKQPTEYAGQRQ